ncbi:MAG: STAS domain-containing protein [Gammaproteobacteria bacterium]|jgi:anti-sigma B factor antagonist|nr:STAS domain-containing protein [Gammaproteobacteria bacterium]
MAYEVQEDRGFAIVRLTGDVDLSCSPEARKTILDSLDSSHNTVVDLSQVSYIDSSGVASLVEGYQTAKKKNLKFGLIGVSGPALSVLELARLDKVFPIYADIEECLKQNG